MTGWVYYENTFKRIRSFYNEGFCQKNNTDIYRANDEPSEIMKKLEKHRENDNHLIKEVSDNVSGYLKSLGLDS
jgi:hypothetical protein